MAAFDTLARTSTKRSIRARIEPRRRREGASRPVWSGFLAGSLLDKAGSGQGEEQNDLGVLGLCGFVLIGVTMKMSRILSMNVKVVGCALTVLVLIAISYFVCFCKHEADTVAKGAATVSDLGHLRNALLGYYYENRQWPTTLRYPDVPSTIPTDPFSRKPYLYTPDGLKPTDDAIIVTQPEPFRTRLWPFSQMKRYVLLANGEVHTLDAEAAFTLRKK